MTKIAAMQNGCIEKEEVESPVPTCGREVYHRLSAPYFFIIMYIVQLYKEDRTIFHMLGCRSVPLPGTERIVKHFDVFS